MLHSKKISQVLECKEQVRIAHLSSADRTFGTCLYRHVRSDSDRIQSSRSVIYIS